VFGERSTVWSIPRKSKDKGEFSEVKRNYLPMHSVLGSMRQKTRCQQDRGLSKGRNGLSSRCRCIHPAETPTP